LVFRTDNGFATHWQRLHLHIFEVPTLMINQRPWFRYCAIVVTVLTFPLTALATTYTVTDLGSLGNGDNPSSAFALNGTGQVAGIWYPSTPPARAFLYSGGTMIDLGTLTAGSGAVAYGINNKGQVVGLSGSFDFDFGQHAFLYSNGTMVDLGTFGGFHSAATAINDAGQVAGYNEDTRGPGLVRHPILYSGGTATALALGALSDDGEALGINASGQVVGFLYGGAIQHAFLYTQGVVKDLGTLVAGAHTVARAINGMGQVVGSSGSHAFLYSEGAMTDLGAVASFPSNAAYYASGINSQGQIVGAAAYQVGSNNGFPVVANQAWIYSGGMMRDLTSQLDPGSGWSIRQAAAINDAGQIGGTGCGAAGPCHAVLLSPSQNVGDAVEYYNAQRDHYFMTAYATEIALLDAGHFPGWVRTGQQFPVYLVDTSVGGVPSGLSPVCRYYGLASAGLDTHFFSASTVECAEVMEKWPTQWILETPNAFYAYPPNTNDGTCPNAAVPVYRLYNNRPDVNHRYTASLAIRQQMIDAGWIPEGYGNMAVGMCVITR
jgi:probable HAF family extracellular repeat protein